MRWVVWIVSLFAIVCTAHASPAITLKPCHIADVKDELRCGVFRVPETRAFKSGRQLGLKVIVLPSRKQPAKEPVFFLSGGPGQAATMEARGLAGAWVRDEHDIVLVDMRGTGEGTRLDCDLGGSDADLQSYIEPLFHNGARYGECAKALSRKADLTQYTTTAAMQDLDDLRAALGYDKIDLYGGSYGTRAAMVYLHLFASHAHLAILSGVSPPEDRSPLFHAAAAQRSLDILISQCAADAACHRAFPDPKGDLNAILSMLARKPVKVAVKHPRTGKPVTVTLTASAFGDGLRVMLYDEAFSRNVPLLLKQARSGNFAPFADVAMENGHGMSRSLAMGLLLSVSCTEDLSRIDPVEIERETRGDFIGDYRVRGQLAACGTWPRGNLPKDYAALFRTNVPVVLISGNLDPVTPPRWGDVASHHFPNSLHIVMPGAHVSDNDCVERILKTFLKTARVKGLDTSCVDATRLPPFVLIAKK